MTEEEIIRHNFEKTNKSEIRKLDLKKELSKFLKDYIERNPEITDLEIQNVLLEKTIRYNDYFIKKELGIVQI